MAAGCFLLRGHAFRSLYRCLCACRFLLLLLVTAGFTQSQHHLLAFASSGTWRWTRTMAPSCSTTSSSPNPSPARATQRTQHHSSSGLPAANAAPSSAAWPTRSVSHILFVDSPVGAGFSFSREPKGYEVGDISASMQLIKFLIKWFSDHPKYLASPFYIGGDSYAGKIAPFLAQMVSEGIEAGRRPLFNLKGYLVGNPTTGEIIDINSRVPYAHGVGIISDQLYELISEVRQGEILMNTCAFESPVRHEGNSKMDGSDGRKILKEEVRVGQLNHPPAPPFDCTTYGYYLSYYWANDRRTRDALGIKEGTKDEWVRCHDKDLLPYSYELKSVIKYHRNLTSRGYRALAYSGDHDLMVPHLGTQAWVRSLNFSIVADWRAWHFGGQSAGFTISYSNNMTFATIKGGGHTAPEYEPERCFAMFSRWILNRPL